MPWLALAVGSAILATVFALGLGVPRERPPGLRGLVVRWGHPFVWLSLGAMFLTLEAKVDALVQPLGLLAGAGYLVYLGTLLTSSPGRHRPPGPGR